MNLIKLNNLSMLFFQKSLCKHLHSLFSFNRVLLYLLNQNFMLIIHHCSERIHLCSWVLSIVHVYQKVINKLFKLFFPYVFFHKVNKILTVLLDKFTAPWHWGVIRYSIDSSDSFRFTKFSITLFIELSSFINPMSSINILCDEAFLGS